MLPVYLNTQDDYGLWADSPDRLVGQKCASIAVIEWVLFISECTYNGTYSNWYRAPGSASAT